MVAALRPPIPSFLGEVSKGPTLGQPLHQQLRSIARDAVVFFREMVPCLMVLKSSGVDLEQLLKTFDEPPPVMVRRLLTGYFQRAMDADLARSADPLAAASLFLGAFHMHSFISHLTDEVMSDEDLFAFSDAVVDVLWHGIAPQEAL